MFTMFIQVCWKTEKSPPCSSGFPIRRGGWFPPPKLEICLPFCKNFSFFLTNFWKSFIKLWQKTDFYTLFGTFPTESRIKTIFMNKIPPKVDEFSILHSVSPGKPFETLYAKILRLSAEFSSSPNFENNRESWWSFGWWFIFYYFEVLLLSQQ
jgi:hypothetical protein